MRQPRFRTSTRVRWWSGVLVAVLAVVVIVLVVLAFQRTRGGAPVEQSPRPVPSFSPSPDETPSPTATPTATPTPVVITAPGAEERFLSAGSGALWRATAGACGGTEPLLERSTDEGRTWNDVTPRYLGIGQILSLNAFAGTEAQLVALMGADCEVQGLRTFTQGRFWEPNAEVLAGATYLVPDGAEVITPSGRVEAPCDAPWGVRAGGGATALVCDGIAYTLVDDEWEQVAENALAVALQSGAVVTAAVAPGCNGITISGVASTCVQVESPSAPSAITTSGPNTLIWALDTLETVATP
ncbi:hypothetical protein F6J84_12535 [Microbacterium caowuchunii]|uniref:hypothetical protein n=1 Tax=Microbacterium caowuchunii TaxID=2614638 RepID=UPI001246C925|nr:hypothetical protein [Microbacterium caowuchunii]QEW00848.1 hypothetical protein F6J84_12535 [Microbacterium caowuchunii]